MLFNEPKLLKSSSAPRSTPSALSFSALQRAEIAEMFLPIFERVPLVGFSALQRAEIAEMPDRFNFVLSGACFSALQRAEIAEIGSRVLASRAGDAFQCSSTSRNC